MLIFQDLEASTQSARIRTGVNEMMSRFVLPIRSCEGTAIPLTLCPGHRLDAHPGRLSLPLTLAGAVFQPHPLVVAALPAAVPH